ncbi:MAG: enoyl-CoA hydratase/isomerase [Pseudomonadales bacterium]
MSYQTLKVRFEESSTAQGKEDICFIQLYRPEANNTINDQLIDECRQVLGICHDNVKLVVLEGLPEVFCFGADFKGMADQTSQAEPTQSQPEPAYDLWTQLAKGPYVTVAHVRGKTNAGGMGFVAACDIVLADSQAEFSLSELLFGLMPACVLPFLIRRIGFQKAHSLTLMTKPIAVKDAHQWGLVDAYADDSQALLRQHLLRLKRLNKTAITRYKSYINKLDDYLATSKPKALAANLEVFSDQENLAKITRYVKMGQFPWET